jgi:hypothetical protein
VFVYLLNLPEGLGTNSAESEPDIAGRKWDRNEMQNDDLSEAVTETMRENALDTFRLQYAERVLALTGRDFSKAAFVLGLHDHDLLTLVACRTN